MSAAAPKMSQRRLGPNATRVVVLSAIALAVALVVFALERSAGGTYEMKAVFDDVRGLIPGGDVTAGALTVGTVTEVEFDESYDPLVTFEVDERVELHEGAIADIRLGSNVGAVNRVIDLTTGDPNAPKLPEGTTLAGTATDQPVNFDDAVRTLDPRTREHIKGLIGGLDEAIKGRGEDFDRTLRRSAVATNETANLLLEVNRDGEALRTLVREGGRVTGALASSPDDLGASVERTASLLAVTAARQVELAESIQLLGPALARGRETLDRLVEAIPNLRELVNGLRPVVDSLGPATRLVPSLVDAAAPFLGQTRKLVLGGPDDLKALTPVAKGAIPVARRLTPVVKFATPLGEELRVYAPEIIGFFQNFGAASGGYDANGHLVRTAAGLAPTLPASTQAGGPIGADECTPGLLELPFIRFPGTNECEPWTDYEDSFLTEGPSE